MGSGHAKVDIGEPSQSDKSVIQKFLPRDVARSLFTNKTQWEVFEEIFTKCLVRSPIIVQTMTSLHVSPLEKVLTGFI